MELQKRCIGYVKLHSLEQIERMNNRQCPVCGLPKEQWKRRTDWTCCSIACSEENKKLYTSWQSFKLLAFKRDCFTCVKCGFKGDISCLIADHIKPISLGGEEFELDNIQTLCKACNKIKTKNDMRIIAAERKRPKEQEKLK